MRKIFLIAVLSCNLNADAKDYPASLFNIYSDGITLNTRSIQFALDHIEKQGGGRLVFDVGRFLTGTIHLRSHVSIHLREGAVLLGSLNPFDYDRKNLTALILAHDVENSGITGPGVIDGQGREVARNVAAIVHKGLIKDAFRNDRPEVEIRPMLIYFRNCRNITIKGITLKNAAAWVQTYDQCKLLTIDSITVDSRAFWNNDGVDIVDCDSVRLSNSYIDSDDDGICLKSHDANFVCQNIEIENCTIRSSANGIKFGTASRGGFRNVKIKGIRVFDTYRSVLALEAVDGGFIENVNVDNVKAVNTGHGIFLRIGERWAPGKKAKLENVTISNFSVEIAAAKPDSKYEYEGPIEDLPRNISPAIIIAGLPDAFVKNITFNAVTITHPGGANPNYARVQLNQLDSIPEKPSAYPEFSMFKELPAWAIFARHAQGIKFEKLSATCLKNDFRHAIVVDDVHGCSFISPVVSEPVKKDAVYKNRSTKIEFK